MDLTNMIPGGAGEEKTPQQQLSKEEYAAMKKQQREEVWAEVDAQAQAVFQNGESSVDLRTESRSNGGKIL